MAGRSTVYAPHGAIATSQPLATAAGLAVLQRGEHEQVGALVVAPGPFADPRHDVVGKVELAHGQPS